MPLKIVLVAHFALSSLPALACNEECAAGFSFDDARATCIRLPAV